ncbi:hypothetical protein CEXT_596411 [Caerostris extrusa]|uniref:Uncharacterized protein n=1 Tax=Caerostris extrusa TaxID=172846 RepID=A0AAV4TGW1_CAEEX|nr:hypothetical protein CEXT_596411 [Caerostris extrusa]
MPGGEKKKRNKKNNNKESRRRSTPLLLPYFGSSDIPKCLFLQEPLQVKDRFGSLMKPKPKMVPTDWGLSARRREKKGTKVLQQQRIKKKILHQPLLLPFIFSCSPIPKWFFPPRASSSKGSIWKLNEAKPKMVPTGWCLSPGGGGRRGV